MFQADETLNDRSSAPNIRYQFDASLNNGYNWITMTNYFKSVGTKSVIKSDQPFTGEDADPKLLLEYLRKQPKPKSRALIIDDMYKDWCKKIFNKFNIVVQGRESKFKLLETFAKRYLTSERVGVRGITTVVLHGFTPITLENFSNGVFGTTKGKSVSNEVKKEFLVRTRHTETHYVFLIHSFESLHIECKDICDIIFDLYRGCPEFIHIILSSDHINGGKILTKYKQSLRFVFFFVPYGESFLYERTHACLTDGSAKDAMMDQNLELASLKDVHQAMQKSCQQVMVYILKYHLEQNRASQFARIQLEFSQLFQQCESKFWLRRANMLRDHLGELADHQIIKQEGNTIQCLIGLQTCEKFLQSVGESVDQM